MIIIQKLKLLMLLTVSTMLSLNIFAQDVFPDGTPIPNWFKQNKPTDINKLGKHYRITDYNLLNDSTVIQTKNLQAVIDKASENGGVVIIPKGTFLCGSLFFKKGTHLHL